MSAATSDVILKINNVSKLFGPVAATVTEPNLKRLYGLPMRFVAVEGAAMPWAVPLLHALDGVPA